MLVPVLALLARNGRSTFGRTLKVAIVTCVLTAFLVAGAACGAGTSGDGGQAASARDPRRDIQPEAQKRADSILLNLSDFPEGWRASPSHDRDREEFQRCVGVDLSSLTTTGYAEPKVFTQGDDFVASSGGSVFKSDEQAKAAIREVSEAVERHAVDRCIRDSIEQGSANDARGGRLEFGRVTARRLNLTPLEVETRAWRITFPFKETYPDGAEVSSKLHLDLVQLREGDTVAVVQTFDNPVNDFDPHLRDKLARVVADRMTRVSGQP